MPAIDQEAKEKFLRYDLYDALRWLFVGAVAWQAAQTKPEWAGHNRIVLGMFTSLVQARALYEFFCGSNNRRPDDARSCDFRWAPGATALYSKYMATGQPANKRVFHLVYHRSRHPGGVRQAQLKHQVLAFAKELCWLTDQLARNSDEGFRRKIKSALRRALRQADIAAKEYDIPNPLEEAKSGLAQSRRGKSANPGS